MIFSRITVVVLCGITILWLPMVKTSQGGQIFIYLNAVQAYFGTPVGIVFLWAMLWKRCTEKVNEIELANYVSSCNGCCGHICYSNYTD